MMVTEVQEERERKYGGEEVKREKKRGRGRKERVLCCKLGCVMSVKEDVRRKTEKGRHAF
jgi:hypothetical protein